MLQIGLARLAGLSRIGARKTSVTENPRRAIEAGFLLVDAASQRFLSQSRWYASANLLKRTHSFCPGALSRSRIVNRNGPKRKSYVGTKHTRAGNHRGYRRCW